jgi:TAT (twin-arginine translocation) pathway signal sequence
MGSNVHSDIPRRDFLKLAGAVGALGVTGSALAATTRTVRILIDPEDLGISSAPVAWATEKLMQALTAKGAVGEIVHSAGQSSADLSYVIVARTKSQLAKNFPQSNSALESSESVRMAPVRLAGVPAIWISAVDQRGFIYGLLELAERVQFSEDSSIGLHLSQAIEEKPASDVRSVARAFCSELEDKPWYYDRAFWRGYLDALATSRFNRFNFAFGFGYDFPNGVTGDYFHFPYPYLVDVPGYKVRVIRLRDENGEVSPAPLDDSERERNLQMLRFIASETAARGLQFQLGIWTHAYEWTKSPLAHHHIEGLTPETHATYCRDALAILLKTCPEIQGLTLRVHGESGVPEGSYPFWQTLFEAIASCGRKVEIDMHAKGINQIMIDMATRTGMPVKVSAKSWAEHMGLGYHQADIRELEIPRADRMESGVFSVSNGERRFTRYGYADLFQEGRKFDVLFRLWPGTQRHLLWGDPATAAAYGRTASFCGASGLEICEPLTFKGREGSGLPGGRCAYIDSSLNPKSGDWQKFEYSYRLWGRLLYNPETPPETWRRYLRAEFGAGAGAVEVAVGNASRILPLITTTHLPSASNHSFWPEIYDNMPIVLDSEPSPYRDTPDPKCFGTVSPLDPQLFSTIVEHAKDLLTGQQSAKYSPIEVAQWLEDFTTTSSQALTTARREFSHTTPPFQRMEEDVLIQNGLGLFFAAKLKSGVLFEIYQQTGDPEAGRLALAEYQKARTSWVAMAERAKRIYRSNITYGNIPMRRGHWIDRIAGIDLDIAAMQARLKTLPATSAGTTQSAAQMIRMATERVQRPSVECRHVPPSNFIPGKPLSVSLAMTGSDIPSSIHLYYRHVNQAERWQFIPMKHEHGLYQSAVPAEYTKSVFPIQYYFELRKTKSAWFYPAFNPTLSNQPYYAIAKRV